MKKAQIKKSVSALAMAAVIAVSLFWLRLRCKACLYQF